MKGLFYSAFLLVFIFVGCTQNNAKKPLDAVSGDEGLKEGTITFPSKDGILISADFYPCADARGIVILGHQSGFSRGEYKEIAPRLVDSGYACLAVDLRSGRAVNGIENRTFLAATKEARPTNYLDAKQDIEAAVDYVAENSDKPIVLWGSSYSASLALIVGNKDPRVKQIVAFSPGEYFSNQSTVKSGVLGLNKPTFITATNTEWDLTAKNIIGVIPEHSVVAFKPDFQTDHGAKALWPTSPSADKLFDAVFDFL